ncbi:MAG: PH domain-containing protein [Bacteroidota bacterium]
MENQDPTAIRVTFNPLIRTYIFWYVAFFLTISIVGLVVLPFWLLGLGQWYSKLYFEKLECELTSRNLRFKRGILFQFEKTIPLENIQDLTFTEGPLLRKLQLSNIRVETAGQSVHNANHMSLIGIIDAHAFRQALLERRHELKQQSTSPSDPLLKISEQLGTIINLLEKKQAQ